MLSWIRRNLTTDGRLENEAVERAVNPSLFNTLFSRDESLDKIKFTFAKSPFSEASYNSSKKIGQCTKILNN
jgi:hypothetical protein